MAIYRKGGYSGLWYEWSMGHTVGIQIEPGGNDVDAYSIGDFGGDVVTFEEFMESVDSRELQSAREDDPDVNPNWV